MARLGDIATYINGFAFKPSDWSDSGVPIIRIQDLTGNSYQANRYSGEYDKKYEVLPGDVLISWSASLGIYVWAGERAVLNQHIFKVVFDKCEIDKSFFVHQVQNILEKAASSAHGATMKHLTKPVFDALPFYLPPLEEQRRISTLLDKVSDLIAKRRAQLDKLDLLVKARFVEMTEDSETVPTRMGDVATYLNGYAFKPTNWSENGLPIIRIQNLNNANAEYNYFDGVLPEKYLVRKGDVLVSWATHLEAYIWKGHDAWLNQHIFKVVFDKIPINDVYFVYSTEEALRQAFKNAHGFKPTMEHIKRSDFEDAVIQLPNVEVQNKFAKFAAQVDKSKLTIQQSLDKLEILKKALMQQYFGDL